MPVPNDTDQYDSYFQTGERSIPVVLTHRIKKSTTTETRIPVRVTIRRSNRTIKAKSVPIISLYNMRSIWSKLENLADDIQERNSDLTLLTEIWQGSNNKKTQRKAGNTLQRKGFHLYF